MNISLKRDLLVNQGATVTGADFVWMGGYMCLLVEGSTVNNTVKVQIKTSQGTYIDIYTAGTVNEFKQVGYVPPGTIRGVTGASAAAIYISALRVNT